MDELIEIKQIFLQMAKRQAEFEEENNKTLSEMITKQDSFENKLNSLLEQQADFFIKQSELDLSLNKKIEILVEQQSKNTQDIKTLTEIVTTMALQADQHKEETKKNVDTRVKNLEQDKE